LQPFQQLLHEALNLLDQFPNVVAKLKQVLATLVFPPATGKVIPLIDPRSYQNALTVRELFRILAPHWNPLSPDLLGFLLEASGCSMAVTKFAEFIETKHWGKNWEGALVKRVRLPQKRMKQGLRATQAVELMLASFPGLRLQFLFCILQAIKNWPGNEGILMFFTASLARPARLFILPSEKSSGNETSSQLALRLSD